MRSYHRKITLILTILAVCLTWGIGAWCLNHAAAAEIVNGTPLPDTGQTKGGTGVFGEDSDYLINPPCYTKLDENGNDLPDSAATWAMVRDNVTQLVWEVKTNDRSIHDRHNKYNWQNAQDGFIPALNSEEFGGNSDWRMPTIKELASITHLGRYDPAIDTDYFPNTVSIAYLASYWSCSGARRLNFHLGSDGAGDKSDRCYVRAVRGGQTELSDHLVINGDGTVTDIFTGLMWQQATEGKMNWEAAISHCEALSLAGYDDWRLPNRRELRSIIDHSRRDPAIDTSVFPNTGVSYYLSSTTRADFTASLAWYIAFPSGSDGVFNWCCVSGNNYNFRAVRGGQPWLSGHLIIFSPQQGSIWELRDSMPITWDTQGIPGDVEISISRQGGKGGTFEILAAATENNGSYGWTVSGTPTVNCALRIIPLNDPDKKTTQGVFSIKARPVPPTVSTTGISAITPTTASSGGNITDEGDTSVTARGVCWSTSENPTTVDSHTSDGSGTGAFPSSITGLNPDTTYHLRAYATNSASTGYGADISFTTTAVDTLYVEADGDCAEHQPCYTTIQAAFNAAEDGDTILVCHGDYFESVVLNDAKRIRLSCGWDNAFEGNTLFSTVNAFMIEKGTMIVEGLYLSGEQLSLNSQVRARNLHGEKTLNSL